MSRSRSKFTAGDSLVSVDIFKLEFKDNWIGPVDMLDIIDSWLGGIASTDCPLAFDLCFLTCSSNFLTVDVGGTPVGNESLGAS